MSEAAIAYHHTKGFQKRFFILVATVSISGFSQGLLLSLLSVILDRQGVRADFNGLSSAALYVGMLLASPFMEAPVRKFGYKPIILFGMSLLIGSMILFPLWLNFYFWILLRFLVGIGDNALHFATQVWITSTVAANKRGRSISLYGLSYGIGFAAGPLGLMLLPYGEWVPFAVSMLLFFIILIPILRLQNEKPELGRETHVEKRYLKVYAIAGVALMPFFIYGFLESTLNSIFPIYGMRTGLELSTISKLLSAFVIGSLILQLPLGTLSDYIGRRKVLILATFSGGILFALVPMFHTTIPLYIIFTLAGGLVGSLYSLGLAYVADLIGPALIPTANIIATIHFGVGSIIGPYLGGSFINHISPQSLFYLIGVVVVSFAFFGIFSTLVKRCINRRKTNI
ncbi:MAG: MFS transporter [Tepidibacillus sp.]